MPVTLNDDIVWFDETLKLEQICKQVATLQANDQSVLLLSHFEATLSQLAASLTANGVRYERFASLNPAELCLQSPAKIWVGAARAFRVTHELRATSAGPALEIIVAEHHPMQSQDGELVDAAAKLACNARLCFYFSLDDPLLQYFGSDSIKALFVRLGIDRSECISHHLINTAIHTAQEKIERKVGKDVPTYSADDWFKYNFPAKK
jgi:preprotein translocase subunit SecA